MWGVPRLHNAMTRPDGASMIFVFGSNTTGRHGKGAAVFARRFCGAIDGCGEGAQGNAYAIPTKDEAMRARPLTSIEASVDRFGQYAAEHPNVTFQITRVGCGLAGHGDADVWPLFRDRVPDNCRPPGVWLQRSDPTLMRVIVAGGRDYGQKPGQADAMHRDLDRLLAKYPQIEIVSGMARGADRMGHDWAKSRHVPVAQFPADWDHYGKPASFVRNDLMAWYATHLVAYWDGQSKGTGHMARTARAGGLGC